MQCRKGRLNEGAKVTLLRSDLLFFQTFFSQLFFVLLLLESCQRFLLLRSFVFLMSFLQRFYFALKGTKGSLCGGVLCGLLAQRWEALVAHRGIVAHECHCANEHARLSTLVWHSLIDNVTFLRRSAHEHLSSLCQPTFEFGTVWL